MSKNTLSVSLEGLLGLVPKGIEGGAVHENVMCIFKGPATVTTKL